MSDRETRQSPPVWMRGLMKRYGRHAIVALALGLVGAGCSALLMFTSGYLIGRTAQAGVTLFMVMVPVAFVQLFGLGRPIARYFERLVSHDWVFRVTSDLRLALFRAIGKRAGDPARARPIGAYLGLLSDDIGHLQNLYLRVAFPLVIAYLLGIAALAFCGAFSWRLALCMLAALAIPALALPALALRITGKSRQAGKDARQAEYAHLTDDVMGSVDWALAGRGAQAAQAHARACAHADRLESSARSAIRATELASALVMGVIACAMVVAAALSFEGGGQPACLIAAFALGLFPLIEAFAPLPSALADSTNHQRSLQRLDELLADSPTQKRADAVPDAIGQRGLPLKERRADLHLDSVSYHYPGATRAALDGVSLDIPAGQALAVLGRSGAGKSTLASLLRGGIQPDCGAIGALAENGRGIPLASAVSYIPQTPHVFDRTLRENLAMADPSADDETLTRALRKVGLGQKLESLERGLDTRVGETGTGLSGGECHRLALARALLAGTPVVVLDEPFASLDPLTERQLLDTLLDAFSGKTLVVITHHLTGIERFDRVVFIEDGKVALDGDPRELARDDARFQALLAFDRGALRG